MAIAVYASPLAPFSILAEAKGKRQLTLDLSEFKCSFLFYSYLFCSYVSLSVSALHFNVTMSPSPVLYECVYCVRPSNFLAFSPLPLSSISSVTL